MERERTQERYTFGELVRQFRVREHFSQQALAIHLGIHRNTITHWEQGDYLPKTRRALYELAQALRLNNQETNQLLEAAFFLKDEHAGLPTTPEVWNVPYPRTPFFTGREDILERIHTMLHAQPSAASTRRLAITGLGGIGKTQTAVEYAHRFHQEYQAVLWVRGETYDLLATDFMRLATLLNLPFKNDKEQHVVLRAVKGWLADHAGWLLLVDNLENISLLKDCVPLDHTGHILLTTRAQSLGLFAQSIHLEGMEPEEGALLLLRRMRGLDNDARLESVEPEPLHLARTLSQMMGGLPLALNQAAAYIDVTQCSLLDYVRLFESHFFQLLQEQDSSSDYPLSVVRTFALAFEQVQKKNAGAAELLTVCAFLLPDAIPEAFLIQSASFLGPALETLLSQPIALNAAFKDLRGYSLLQRHSDTKTLSLHRLVQLVLREGMPQALKHMWLMRVISALEHAFPLLSPLIQQMEVEQWPWCELLLPQALEALSVCKHWDLSTREVTLLLVKVAIYLSERARYEEAEALLLRARSIQEQTPGLEHAEAAILLEALALLYKRKGKYQQAEPLFRSAQSLWERARGADCVQGTGPLIGLADLYRYQGNYAEAEALLLQAIPLLKSRLGPQALACAYPLYILAHLYAQQGRYQEAEPLYQHARAIWERGLGEEHPQVAGPLLGLAELARQKGKYTEAEPLYLQAYDLLEHALGADHPQVTFPLSNLAALYCKQGKYQEAEALYQRVLSIRQQALGPTHLQVMIPLANLADVYKDQGKYAEAEPLLQRAIALLEEHYGLEHPQVAYPLHSLAVIYSEQGKDAEAEALYQRAIALLEQHVAPNHPELTLAREDLAHLYLKRNNDEKAAPFF